MTIRHAMVLAALAGAVDAADVACPAYPDSFRAALMSRIAEERAWSSAGRKARPYRPAGSSNINFIDDFLFAQMERSNVLPAPDSDDAEFLRRVSLDLTGEIPSPDEVEAFLADSDPNKRAALIERLMARTQFVDYWTLYFAKMFEVTSNYYSFVGIQGRNQFHRWLREWVSADRPYRTGCCSDRRRG